MGLMHQMCHPEVEGSRDGEKAELIHVPPHEHWLELLILSHSTIVWEGKTWLGYKKRCFMDDNYFIFSNGFRHKSQWLQTAEAEACVTDVGSSSQAGLEEMRQMWGRKRFPLKGISSWPRSYLSQSVILKDLGIAWIWGARLELGMKILVCVLVSLQVNYRKVPILCLTTYEIHWYFMNLADSLHLV